MTIPPPLPPRPSRADGDHLNLIAIFHFVLAGMSFLGLGLLGIHWLLMDVVMSNPEIWEKTPGAPPPPQFFSMFRWFYLFLGAVIVLAGAVNVISGICLRTRRHRTFSLVVAGLNCAWFPLGTTLGVFTFIVLFRESVRGLYSATPDRVG